MPISQRRSFVQLALAALPLPAQIPNPESKDHGSNTKPVRVPAGVDREKKKRAIGLCSTTYKVLTQETGGRSL